MIKNTYNDKMYNYRPGTLQTSIKSSGRVVLLALLITSSLFLLAASSGNAYSQNNNNWFVGKGTQENTYYTYEIQHHDVNQGRPFLMTIYLKEFNEEGQYWITPAFVIDQGKVVNGTFHLSALDMSALGSSDIPAEMAPYRSGYSRSLQWLASFVPKPGQSLTAPYWGKIAAIGGKAIAPRGNVKVTIPAGAFDTTVVKWHKGVDNNIWINPNMPYPVKAETFADVTTGNPPVQYTFELQATGKGQPPTPKSQIEVPKPPLTIQTARGTYFIRLLWSPPINPGAPEEFGVLFMDNSQNILSQVNYGFKVTSTTSDTVIEDLRNQKARDGTGVQTVEFPESGPYKIEVNVEAVAGSPMGMFVESASFGVVVE